MVLLGLWVGGRPGALLLPAATLGFLVVRRGPDTGGWRRRAGQWLAPALMIAVAMSGAAADLLSDRGDAATITNALSATGPQVACLFIVAAVAAALVLPGGSGRQSPRAGREPAATDPAATAPAGTGPDATDSAAADTTAGPAVPGGSS